MLRRGVIIGAAVAAIIATAPASAAERPVIPPAGHTQVMVGQDVATLRAYSEAMGGGYQPAGVMDYLFLEAEPDALRRRLDKLRAEWDAHYPQADVQFGMTLGRSPFWSTIFGDYGAPGTLEVVSGAYDDRIDVIAEWLNAQPQRTFQLRIGYEFDLPGGQWGPPALYRQAYRYVVDHLRRRGVSNALYVWHSAGAQFKTTDYSGLVSTLGTLDRTPGHEADPLLEAMANTLRTAGQVLGNGGDLAPIRDFFPGRDYVDLFGISYWDDAFGGGRSSERARAIYRQRTQEILDEAKQLGLPLMLAETTPVYIGFDAGEESVTWLQRWFELIERNDIRVASLIVPDWPSLSGGVWGQAYWNGFWPDARVANFAGPRELWRSKLAEDRYGGRTVCVTPRRAVTIRLPRVANTRIRFVRVRTAGRSVLIRRGDRRSIRVPLGRTSAPRVTVWVRVALTDRRTGRRSNRLLRRSVSTCSKSVRLLG
ncbi:hypothetical protein [Paraconexibacter sp.]|uniref:hypothetical protein n=1 Tax=Paraconexibacter sp. TaxID=2949640 RepID=UPI003564B104